MSLWEQIKNALASPVEKKNYLDGYTSADFSDNYYFNFLKRGDTARVSTSNAAEAYKSHELVYACVNKIADVMNDAEIVVERQNAKGEYERIPHPLISLLNRPNSNDICEDFRRKMVISDQSAGITYIVINRSSAGLPAELAVLNPYRINLHKASDGSGVDYYNYRKTDGRTVRIDLKDMLVRRRADLLDQYGGLAPMAVAVKSINSDLGLTTYIDAFFESDGTPSGVLKILNRTVSQTDKEKLQSDWKDKYGRGGSNQKGLAVLDQNAEYQKIGSNLNELDAESISSRFESRICSVFGVPPILIGAYVGLRWVNQRASAKEALKDFWINKISPELKPLRKWLTWVLLPEFENIADIKSGKIRVAWDISQASFLQEEVNDIHDRARKNFLADGWTRNEFRTATGVAPVPDGDIFRSDLVPAKITAPTTLMLPDGTQKGGGEELEKKTEKLENLKDKTEFWREPTATEKQIDLKAKIDDLETAATKLAKLFWQIRLNLIGESAKQIESLGFDNLEFLDLGISSKHSKEAEKLFKEIFKTGQSQIIDELNAQKSANNFESKDIGGFDIFTLVNLVFAKIISEIKNRAINISVLLYSLETYSKKELEKRLLEESLKAFEQLSRNAANLTIQAGRGDEIANQDVKLFEYSGILDGKICSPCKSFDGKQSDSIDKLPKCPNAKCLGGWNCRCFIIGIAD